MALAFASRSTTHHTSSASRTDHDALAQRDRAQCRRLRGHFVRYADAKISFGYSADFFFGAIDGGIDARKNENRGFYGPYASISIGLGD